MVMMVLCNGDGEGVRSDGRALVSACLHIVRGG